MPAIIQSPAFLRLRSQRLTLGILLAALVLANLIALKANTDSPAGVYQSEVGIFFLSITLAPNGIYRARWDADIGSNGTASGSWKLAGDEIQLNPVKEEGHLMTGYLRVLLLREMQGRKALLRKEDLVNKDNPFFYLYLQADPTKPEVATSLKPLRLTEVSLRSVPLKEGERITSIEVEVTDASFSALHIPIDWSFEVGASVSGVAVLKGEAAHGVGMPYDLAEFQRFLTLAHYDNGQYGKPFAIKARLGLCLYDQRTKKESERVIELSPKCIVLEEFATKTVHPADPGPHLEVSPQPQ